MLSCWSGPMAGTHSGYCTRRKARRRNESTSEAQLEQPRSPGLPAGASRSSPQDCAVSTPVSGFDRSLRTIPRLELGELPAVPTRTRKKVCPIRKRNWNARNQSTCNCLHGVVRPRKWQRDRGLLGGSECSKIGPSGSKCTLLKIPRFSLGADTYRMSPAYKVLATDSPASPTLA
jgi:hypothetical protein